MRKNSKAVEKNEDDKNDETENESDEKKILDYSGGFPEYTPKHKCLVKKHLTLEMYNK